ncbi:MAG: prenyltransferase/squalene oxidase repeat-containing protein [Acidobacteriota bacterium]
MTIETLIAAQNSDGGWGYREGSSSWTEPTAYALLALAGDDPAAARGRRWLARNQRPDGGFAPRPSVEESTWVTALAALAGCGPAAEPRAVEWMLSQSNRDSGFVFRLRQWMRGAAALSENNTPGWSWYPGTAGWVVPTSLTLLALGKAARRNSGARLGERIAQGRRFLLDRMCADGGWNHGSSSALGFQSDSYPETTGIALLALHGIEKGRLARSVAKAKEHFRACRSLEGLAWLELGLLAQGAAAPERPAGIPARTLMDSALAAIADRARQGRNVFLEERA